MKEIVDMITPQNFAMIIAIYLLVRFESTIKAMGDQFSTSIKSLEEKIEGKMDAVETAISKSNKLMALMVLKNTTSTDSGELRDVICAGNEPRQ